MNDPIDRQAAIDALADYIHNVDRVYSTGNLSADDCRDAAHSVLDELPSAQPEDYAHGFADGYIQGKKDAQPEIIRCKDCKHYYFAENRIPQEQRYVCDLDGDRWNPDSFCSFAERRTDEIN